MQGLIRKYDTEKLNHSHDGDSGENTILLVPHQISVDNSFLTNFDNAHLTDSEGISSVRSFDLFLLNKF